MAKTFKPMLAGKCESVTDLKYPVMASHKLDGIRAFVIDGVVVSRQLKPIPNKWIQKQFGRLPEGTDGELIFGDPTARDIEGNAIAYRQTVSAVMSEDGEPTEVCYHVFDNFKFTGWFAARFKRLSEEVHDYVRGVLVVPHMPINNAEELATYEQECVDAGHEGIMIRSFDGPYKYGRSTVNEGYLLKLKRFVDTEAVVLDTYERMHNANEATKDNLGHTARSSHQENLVGRGDLGGLDVKGIEGTYNGVEFSVGTGFDDTERKQLWAIRKSLVGKLVKVKYFASGSKDKPRFPVFQGFRSPIDL